MKRLLLALALGAGLLSCSDVDPAFASAGLSGTYDLTIVGRLVFVTSSDRDELRVLDLDAVPREYIRAPNPLEPLSIPVLDRPLALARDVHYGAQGQEVAGPYVYARSAGSQEISVVGADRTLLRELRRLVAPGLVTAIAARGPTTEGGPSQLYYATQSATGGQVWVQELPAPAALADPATVLPQPRLVVPLSPGESVQALLALPPADPTNNPAENSIAIATRVGAGLGGRTVRVDLNAPDQFVELRFGAPVRALATHARAYRLTSLEPRVEETLLTPGQRVFGILDESACGVLSGCAGVLAVDRLTGEVATDATGHPMVPITVGSALPTGLTLAANAQLLVTVRDPATGADQKAIDRLPLLAIVPASNGEITLFNAVELRHFDFEPTGAVAAVELRDAAEQPKASTGRVALSATVVDGATQSDVYRLFYQEVLPGLGAVERVPGTGPRFELSRATVERARVQSGDIIVLEDTQRTPCATELAVARVEPGASAETVALVTDTPIPEECASLPRLSVRAGGAQPFVLYSQTRGFLARMGAGETYTEGATYFYHPNGFNPTVTPVQVSLSLLPTVDPAVVRGDRYVVNVSGQFRPFIVRLNTTSGSGLELFRLPASVAYAVPSDGIDYLYIAYPSADAILQMNLELIFFESLNELGLVVFQ